MKKSTLILVTVVSGFLFSCTGTPGDKPEQQKDTTAALHNQHDMAAMPASTDPGDYAAQVNAGIIKEDTMKGSPVRIAMGNVGHTHVHITYGSPGVKNRIIWGGLVAYDKVWVTGAHKATKINFSSPVTIAGKQIAAGEYAFFTIPGREKWILIVNKNYDQHLADSYNEAEDVVRVEVLPKSDDKAVQRLTYSINKESDTSGAIVMQWEKLGVALPFTTH